MKSNVKVADTLIRFANARERAYKSVGALGMAELKAINHVKTVGGYFSSVAPEKQIKAIPQLEEDLLKILPSEKSRFQKQRNQILDLIAKSHD
ncbi:hypothetical protein [Algoriphagus resistens]|uniref:hypothetical protein n=1 Tax=Algoriphagus resistens TaxID=1750590 RepID=UPI000716BD8E|nr:hypothetical protein [Algoriphagus resistens]